MSSAVNALPVAVVTDSTAGLASAGLPVPAGYPAIHTVPLIVQKDGVEYRENVDITAEQMLESLQNGQYFTTSRPAPEQFGRVYAELAESGVQAAVSLHLSSQLSGTYEAALSAAKSAPIPVEVVDSSSVAMVLGFGVHAAAQEIVANAGERDPTAVAHSAATVAREVFTRGRVLFYVDTLDYLHRGGRIGSVSAILGTALSVKPLLTVTNGHIELSEKVRTRRRALERLVARCVASAKSILDDVAAVDIAIQHLGAPRAGQEALRQIREKLAGQIRHAVLADAGAVLGAHVGPGVIGAIVTPVIHN